MVVLVVGVAAVWAAVSIAQAAVDPYAYDFAPIPGPEEPVKPQPDIDARYSVAYRTCQHAANATTYSLDMCDQAEMKRQDDALNRQWAKAISQLATTRIAELRLAERVWIKARAARCEEASNQYAGGTIVPLIYGSCYIDETIRRDIWLQKLH